MAGMAKIIAMKESLEKALRDESRPWTKVFVMVEKQTGLNRVHAFLAFIVLLAVYLVFGIAQQLICNIIGFIYPAYYSMKALESPNKEDDSKWLTYWIVFALFTIVEFFVDYIVCWFPFYWLMKCLFYVWLMAPTDYNGSALLYRRVVRPKFLQYQKSLDKFLATAKDAVKNSAEQLLADKRD